MDRLFLCACLAAALRAQDLPPSDYLNRHLPHWLSFSGEARTRYEGFTGAGFQHSANDDHLLSRIRLNMLVQPFSRISFHFQGQDARVFGTRQNPLPTSYQDTFDLRIGYVEIGNSEKDPAAVRAGRQELNFGEQRLIGYNSWRNTAQSFDAVRVILRFARFRLDVFASAGVQVQDRFNRTVPGNNLHGIYGSIKGHRRRVTVEPYVLWRLSPSWRVEAGGFGRLDAKYTGAHIFGRTGGAWDYDTEFVTETGHSGGDRIRAWAAHSRAGYSTATGRLLTHWIVEYNHASGDRDPHDGRQGGFTAPYPSVHDRYGLADQVGWKNIHHVRTGAEWQIAPGWQLIGNVQNYWLDSRTDGLFTPSNLQLARVESGARSHRVGWELDVSAVWSVTPLLELGAGYARLFPGPFLRQATPGVAYNYAYCLVNYRF